MFEINRSLGERKQELLLYFRGRAEESLEKIRNEYGVHQFRESATAINRAIMGTKDTLVKAVAQKAQLERWMNEDMLKCVLMITYASYVVMLESRNEVWPYDYMAFSRRVGELWEPFCKLCFEHPLSNAVLFVPPLFSEIKKKLTDEIGSV